MLVHVIENKITLKNYIEEVWLYRHLIRLFAWRDISVKYKQTMLGFLWVLFRPLALILIFTFLFNKVARVNSGDTPYILIVLTGMLPWLYFSTTFAECTNSIVANASLVNKVYFPRVLLLVSSSITNLIDATVHIAILIILCLLLDIKITSHFMYIPMFYIMIGFVAVAFSLLFASLNVKYRDIQQIMPFLLQLLLYLSPVAYSSSLISDKYRSLYSLNPVVGIVESFRWIVIPHESNINHLDLLSTLIWTILLLIIGINVFIKSESTFSDYM